MTLRVCLRLKARDRVPTNTWSRLELGEIQALWREARRRGVLTASVDVEDLTLRLLADRYGKALYRERDGFFKPRNMKGRNIHWTRFQGQNT